MVHHFLRTNPYKMSIFQRSVTCSLFFRNCSHILTRTQGKKFEDMFLVKIASKGTSLSSSFLEVHVSSFLFFGGGGGGGWQGRRTSHVFFFSSILFNFQGKVENFCHPTFLKIRFKISVTPLLEKGQSQNYGASINSNGLLTLNGLLSLKFLLHMTTSFVKENIKENNFNNCI